MAGSRPIRTLGAALAAAWLAVGGARDARAQSAPAVDYHRAERLLDWNIDHNILGVPLHVQWLDGDRFQYAVRQADGLAFFEVDPVSNTVERMLGPSRAPGPPANVVRSPDGRWDAYVENDDVYVRPASGGAGIRLTTDGTPLAPYGYGHNANNLNPRVVLRWGGIERVAAPVIIWSPDSRRILVQRADNRGVGLMTLVSSTTTRPTAIQWPYALPGDSIVDRYSYVVIDVETRTLVPARMPPIPHLLGHTMPMAQPPGEGTIHWAPDSETVFLMTGDRGPRHLTLVAVDARTGEVREVVGDTTTTSTVDVNDWALSPDGRDIFWYSWRDGWGHLYRYGVDGSFRNRVTGGEWSVRRIVHVDGARQQLYFTANGREPDQFPYHVHLYRVGFDGSDLTLLTPEPGDHEVRISPSGRFIIDTYSTVDTPPVTVLRSAEDGRVLRTLARADISRILEAGFTPPRTVRMTADDGVTEIYGLMYTPSDFDPSRKYPVIDHFYGAPGPGVSPWGFMRWSGRGFARALAELGFVVVEISARGTSGRSKAFLDAFHGEMGLNTLPDHVAGIRDLARQYPFLDTTRVGIYGQSRGGYAAAAAVLRYPEFFKVAVAAAGNHDNRGYRAVWGEKFQGPYSRDPETGGDNFDGQANHELAANLEGHLLLIHGDMDDNVHPSSTLRLAHALIRENKRFDMMIVPDADHGVLRTPYAIRMTIDYFVQHLLGAVPPRNHVFRPPGG